jgi:hypothetical protein
VLHSRVGSWPYSQTVDQAGRLARNKRFSLLGAFVNYGPKKFYNIGPRALRISA